MVLWLRIRLPMQGTGARSLVREDPTCCKATKPVRQLLSMHSRACEPQLLSPCATTTEACTARACALQQREATTKKNKTNKNKNKKTKKQKKQNALVSPSLTITFTEKQQIQ